MKRFSFLQVGLLAALMVAMASCAVPMGGTGDYYEDAPTRRNAYYGDPYYGGVNTIIVERDPFTGRYYQVAPGPYGRVYGAPAYPYGGRNYSRGRNYNNRNNNAGRTNGYYKTYPQAQPRQMQPQQSPAQRQQVQQQRQDAKDAILGKKRN
jgi:hypothetical protein